MIASEKYHRHGALPAWLNEAIQANRHGALPTWLNEPIPANASPIAFDDNLSGRLVFVARQPPRGE